MYTLFGFVLVSLVMLFDRHTHTHTGTVIMIYNQLLDENTNTVQRDEKVMSSI